MHHAYPRDFLRTCRRSAGLSQEELTRLMGFTSRSHLSRIERGKQALQLEQALRYELLFGVPMAKITPAFCGNTINGLWEDIVSETGCSGRPQQSSRRQKAQPVTHRASTH